MSLLDKQADLMPLIVNIECENIIKTYNLMIKSNQLSSAYQIIRNYLKKHYIRYNSPQFNYEMFLTSILQVNPDLYTAIVLAIVSHTFKPSRITTLRSQQNNTTHNIGYSNDVVSRICQTYQQLLDHADFDCNNLLLPDEAKEIIKAYSDTKYDRCINVKRAMH